MLGRVVHAHVKMPSPDGSPAQPLLNALAAGCPSHVWPTRKREKVQRPFGSLERCVRDSASGRRGPQVDRVSAQVTEVGEVSERRARGEVRPCGDRPDRRGEVRACSMSPRTRWSRVRGNACTASVPRKSTRHVPACLHSSRRRRSKRTVRRKTGCCRHRSCCCPSGSQLPSGSH
jgi:hypothetical protein